MSIGKRSDEPVVGPRSGLHHAGPEALLLYLYTWYRSQSLQECENVRFTIKNRATRADLRAYQRLLAGIAYHSGKRIRFMTLTTASAVNLRRAFQVLIKWIRRNNKRGIEYFCSRTDEGVSGVLHVVFVGAYLPFDELQKEWKELTGAFRVHITELDQKRFGSLMLEMTRQSDMRRYSWSKGWLKPGSVKMWKTLCKKISKGKYSKKEAIDEFEQWNVKEKVFTSPCLC